MRQFSVKNKLGEVYRLNSFEYFFHDPEGLGFTRDMTFQKIGTGYEILKDGFQQNPVSGQIMFKSDAIQSAYKRYLKFTKFLQEIPLTIVYRIPGGEFKMDCVPVRVDKTEINSAFGMDVGIEFSPLSMWYRDIEEEVDDASTILISDSLQESPCCLSFKGLTVSNGNVEWAQEVDDVEVMTGKLTDVTIAATDMIYVRTDTNPYQIYKVDSEDVKTDLYAKSDFSTKRFPLLQKGVNEFTVTGASKMGVKGRILYETV